MFEGVPSSRIGLVRPGADCMGQDRITARTSVAFNENDAANGEMYMARIKGTVALAAAIALGGCGFGDSGLTASGAKNSTGGARQDEAQQSQSDRTVTMQTAQAGAESGGAAARGYSIPSLGDTVFQPQDLPNFQPSDTFVGKKVAELRKDLLRLQENISRHNKRLQSLRQSTIQAARNYHNRVANINTRLQVGTTPGNPELVAMWNGAQTDLEQVDQVVGRMNELANQASSTSALAAFLLESVGASYSLSGAIEKDHEQLAILEDATNRTVVLVDRLLNELSEDVARQNDYLQRERANLSTLSLAVKNGEFYGRSLANQAYGTPEPRQRDSSTGPASKVGSAQPLVVIRFDRDDVNYEQPLYNAISRTLDRRPDAAFDVVAVAPQSGQQAQTSLNRAKARRFAERVLRSLNEMGLPPNRVTLSATTSADVNTNQVQIFIR